MGWIHERKGKFLKFNQRGFNMIYKGWQKKTEGDRWRQRMKKKEWELKGMTENKRGCKRMINGAKAWKRINKAARCENGIQ